MHLAVAIALGAVCILHVFWGVVGVTGPSAALPEIDGKPTFLPTRLASFSVAAGLAIAAYLVLARGGSLPWPLSPALLTAATAAVGLVFVARAVGDFRLVGFFKRVRGSRFARWDSRLYSPFSLAVGVATLGVAFS